ncbi:hypothetical protein L6R52_27120 [Myxococcota bacterium]|nr:hypothetical protein [Myxococcota bacterium]
MRTETRPKLTITVGAGRKNPQGRRVEVEDLAEFLSSQPAAIDAWWSGHLWRGDYRLKEGWEATTAIVLDFDHRDAAGEHSSPPEDRASRLIDARLEDVCSFWYATPRGFRAAFVLDEPITDARLVERATRGAIAAVVEALEAVDLVASFESSGAAR